MNEKLSTPSYNTDTLTLETPASTEYDIDVTDMPDFEATAELPAAHPEAIRAVSAQAVEQTVALETPPELEIDPTRMGNYADKVGRVLDTPSGKVYVKGEMSIGDQAPFQTEFVEVQLETEDGWVTQRLSGPQFEALLNAPAAESQKDYELAA